MKRRRRRRKRRLTKKEKLLITVLVLVVILLAAAIAAAACHSRENKETGEVRAVWLAYVDFKSLGLYNQDEKQFRKNAEAFFAEAEKNSINTVYFHVRAFRDAAYPSSRFPMSRYIWDREEQISYDPLAVMTELAHKNRMEIHAWLNPYRNHNMDEAILDPAAEESTEEILASVREILDNYKVDGIHFDDYFYQESTNLPTAEKMGNVNKMIRAVYQQVKEYGENLRFGISPAGNTGYCESIGADVRTWMSEDGYVDYIVPQIYWTDEHSAAWRKKMFTDTLDEWISINKKKLPLYVGLALYRTGKSEDDDPGWGKHSDILAGQIARLREQQCAGFALFSAKDFFREGAQKELENYRSELKAK
ncbi:family 10 glycosylhydrolase [Anaerovorax odorimutans]|uniref:Family 10 glycosylhydrolase n=1 Tax=Anaerovorax odorimutans TaxID=109327 RepID=A0ABT1RPZ3_9FIRM|nr:family 10 glycosylhydrolase [Anaerovorax odorimutans]MCQ4637267.1 family 10 glycosylhydrolase [Anaerovorax odorimutans]